MCVCATQSASHTAVLLRVLILCPQHYGHLTCWSTLQMQCCTVCFCHVALISVFFGHLVLLSVYFCLVDFLFSPAVTLSCLFKKSSSAAESDTLWAASKHTYTSDERRKYRRHLAACYQHAATGSENLTSHSKQQIQLVKLLLEIALHSLD